LRIWPRSIFFSVFLLASIASPYLWAESQPPIHFGVLSIAPPARIHANWQPFIKYVAEALGRPVEIVVPRGFGKMKKAAASGAVDFFYVNSYVFFRLKEAGKAIGVAQMKNIDGKVFSQSEIFVRADSGIDTVDQLKGKSIAFVAPMGAGGYLAPRAYLYSQGIQTERDTQEVFTKNLSSSIHKVLLGEVAAATMCGVNFKLMSKKVDSGELKRIAVSENYPENVIAARSGLDEATLRKFTAAVTGMSRTEEGRAVLEKMRGMKIQDFLPYDPGLETVTQKLVDQGEF